MWHHVSVMTEHRCALQEIDVRDQEIQRLRGILDSWTPNTAAAPTPDGSGGGVSRVREAEALAELAAARRELEELREENRFMEANFATRGVPLHCWMQLSCIYLC